MSDVRLSSSTKALLRAAKADAPSAAARAKMWAGVSGAVGGAAGVAGAATTATAATGTSAGIGAAKMLTLGTLLGGAVTVGLAVTLLRIAPAPARVPPATPAVARAAHPPGAPADATSLEAPSSPAAASLAASPATPALHRIEQPPSSPPRAAHAPAALPAADEDPLTREAALVLAARAALARGDASSALRAVRTARALPSHQLVPEELAVEAQALRALGRDAEADRADATLRSQYPGAALAR